MKTSLKKLANYTVEGKDGSIGTIVDFLFDIESWVVRYLEIKVGVLYSGKRILIRKTLIEKTNWENENFYINLAIGELNDGPELEKYLPISREYEKALNEYCGTTGYWDYSYFTPRHFCEIDSKEDIKKNLQSHLLSFQETKDDKIYAENEIIGECYDMLIDDKTWEIESLIVSGVEGSEMENSKKILPLDWIKEVDYIDKKIHMNVKKDAIYDVQDLI